MGPIIQRNQAVAKKKGTVATLATGGAVALCFFWAPLGIVGLAGAAYLGYDWFSFRAKNGMKF